MKEQAVTTSLENRQRVRSRVSADPSPSTKAARRHRRQLRFEPRFLMAVGNNATASEPDHRLRGLLQDFGGDEVFKAERSIKLKPSHSFNERPLHPPLRKRQRQVLKTNGMNDTNISTIQEDPGWSITTHHAGLPIEPKNSKLLTLLPPLNGLVHPRCLLESQAEANEQTTSSVKASHSKEASFEEGCQTTVTCSSTLQVSRTRMHDQPPHLWVQSNPCRAIICN